MASSPSVTQHFNTQRRRNRLDTTTAAASLDWPAWPLHDEWWIWLFKDAVHIGDDKRLLVFHTQVCVMFPQSTRLSFLAGVY